MSQRTKERFANLMSPYRKLGIISQELERLGELIDAVACDIDTKERWREMNGQS